MAVRTHQDPASAVYPEISRVAPEPARMADTSIQLRAFGSRTEDRGSAERVSGAAVPGGRALAPLAAVWPPDPGDIV
jgi:hypothetical protein